MSENPTQLHYAPREGKHKRFFKAKWLVAIAIIATAIVASRFYRQIDQRIRLLYWQHECNTHQIHDGGVVFRSNDPQVAITSAEWLSFYKRFSSPGKNSTATVYLGRRMSLNGQARLIAVDLLITSGSISGKSDANLDIRAIIPGTIFQSPEEEQSGFAITDEFSGDWEQVLSATSAVEDKKDQSHFSFTITTSRGIHTYNGWLADNGLVELQDQFTPSAGPSPASSPTTRSLLP